MNDIPMKLALAMEEGAPSTSGKRSGGKRGKFQRSRVFYNRRNVIVEPNNVATEQHSDKQSDVAATRVEPDNVAATSNVHVDITDRRVEESNVATRRFGQGDITAVRGEQSNVATRRLAQGDITAVRGEQINFGTRRLAQGDITAVRGEQINFGTRRLAQGDITAVRGEQSNLATRRLAQGDITAVRREQINFGTRRLAQGDITAVRREQINFGTRRFAQGDITTVCREQINFGTRRLAQGDITAVRREQINFGTRRFGQGDITTVCSQQSNVAPRRFGQGDITAVRGEQSNVAPRRLTQGDITAVRGEQSNVAPRRLAQGDITAVRGGQSNVATSSVNVYANEPHCSHLGRANPYAGATVNHKGSRQWRNNSNIRIVPNNLEISATSHSNSRGGQSDSFGRSISAKSARNSRRFKSKTAAKYKQKQQNDKNDASTSSAAATDTAIGTTTTAASNIDCGPSTSAACRRSDTNEAKDGTAVCHSSAACSSATCSPPNSSVIAGCTSTPMTYASVSKIAAGLKCDSTPTPSSSQPPTIEQPPNKRIGFQSRRPNENAVKLVGRLQKLRSAFNDQKSVAASTSAQIRSRLSGGSSIEYMTSTPSNDSFPSIPLIGSNRSNPHAINSSTTIVSSGSSIDEKEKHTIDRYKGITSITTTDRSRRPNNVAPIHNNGSVVSTAYDDKGNPAAPKKGINLVMTSTRRQTPLTCSGHTRPVVHLAFSGIMNNCFYMISACKDGSPMLRQGDTGDWVGTFNGHKGAVWSVALNKDATLATTGAADFTAKIWDAVTGTELDSYQHNHVVRAVDFDATSEYMVTGGNERIVRIFNLNKEHTAIPDTFTGHGGVIKRATFCRDDRCVLSAAEDKTVRLFDRISGYEVHRLHLPNHPNSVEISADHKIMTITHGPAISFWEVGTLKKIKEIKTPTNVYCASLHPDKSFFVCGGEDFLIYKYNYETGLEIESLKSHFGSVHTVSFSPDGELFASGSEDGTLRLWQTTVGKTYGLWQFAGPDGIKVAQKLPRAGRID